MRKTSSKTQSRLNSGSKTSVVSDQQEEVEIESSDDEVDLYFNRFVLLLKLTVKFELLNSRIKPAFIPFCPILTRFYPILTQKLPYFSPKRKLAMAVLTFQITLAQTNC